MLNDINIDREKVLNKLEKLQVNKAPDVDGIVPELLVNTSVRLSVPLSIILTIYLILALFRMTGKRPMCQLYLKKEIKKIQVTVGLLVFLLRFVKSLSPC